jgi:hypothetical protein
MTAISRTTARTLGTAGAAAALVVVGLAVPTAANAIPTECEPGTVTNALRLTSSDRVVAGSQSSTAATGGPLSAAVSSSASRGSEFSAGASASLMGSITAQVSATATESASWSAGSTLGPVDVPAGGTLTATYGFEDISWQGTTATCLASGQMGPAQTVHGTVQGTTWVEYVLS